MDECALNITQCPDSQLCHNFPGGSSCLCTDSRYGVNCSTSEYLNLASAPFQTALFLTGSVIGVLHDDCQQSDLEHHPHPRPRCKTKYQGSLANEPIAISTKEAHQGLLVLRCRTISLKLKATRVFTEGENRGRPEAE